MTAKSSQPSGLKILFADDEESLQEIMSMELPRMGHTVTVCPDGRFRCSRTGKSREFRLLAGGSRYAGHERHRSYSPLQGSIARD